MGSVFLTGELVCQNDDEVALVVANLPEHIALTRAEPGCVSFSVEREGTSMTWRVSEEFVDQAAFQAHQTRVAASEWGSRTAGIERRYSVTTADGDGPASASPS